MLLNQCVVVISHSFYTFSFLHHLLNCVECFCLQNNSKGEDQTSEICDAMNVWHEISIDNGELQPKKHFES